jgi:DNA polymerase II small subunit
VPIRNRPLVDKDVSVAMMSDLHFGSQLFLKKQFEAFLRFLKGDGTTTEQQKQAGKIKYLVLAGDLVDGIGIYPGQEGHLETKDIFEQYQIFCKYLKEIPEYISIVVVPGNHDAVRIAEPQPPLLPEFLEPVKGYSNIHNLPNPGRVKLEGLETLVYHGGSFFSMISEIPTIANALERPEKVGIEWLRRRHLSPTYGTNPIVPHAKDPLVISHMPDILHFGHVHHNGYEDYRGTMVVNSGTWQDYTDLQTKLGIRITPCELPIYNFKSGQLNILKFRDANLTPDQAVPEARMEMPPCPVHPGERHAPHEKAA